MISPQQSRHFTLAVLCVFVFLFVVSCSLLSVISTEHSMADGSLTHAVHEHVAVPFSLPSQSLFAAAFFAAISSVLAFSIVLKSLYLHIFYHWIIAFRDYRRRMRKRIFCLYSELFQQGILNPKSF